MLVVLARLLICSCGYRNITCALWCYTRYHSNHVASNWLTYSGMQDQYKRDGVQQRPLKRIISHPDYSQMTFDYDIALLELDEPLEFTNTIQPICLPSHSHIFPAGMSCWVTGWGALREGGIMQELVILCGAVVFFFFSFFLFFLFFFFYHFQWLFYSLNNFSAIPQLTMTHSPIVLFLFAYPAHIKIKTSHSSPIPLTISYSSPSFIFFSLPASFFSPSSLSFRPVFSLSFNVPPISLSLPSWHTSLPLSPPSLFSHLFLICSIPLSLLLYPYIKADVGSPGKPLKPSLANTNPAH